MRHRASKLLSIILVFVIVAGLLPGMSLTAHAAGTGKAIQLVDHSGTVSVAANIDGGKGGTAEGGVYFGTYKQSPDGSGDFNWEPIKWRVLSNAEGKLFLLSDQNLDVFRYHTDYESVTWEKSTMRSWLNGYDASENNGGDSGTDYSQKSDDSFIGVAFDAAELAAIAETAVENPYNRNTPGGNNTTDKVFLLSIDEAKSSGYGFVDNNSRISTNTAYVQVGGKIHYDEGINNTMSGVGEADYWWLRSPGSWDRDAANVHDDGSVDSDGYHVYDGYVAVRPALNLNLSSVLFTSAAADGKAGTTGELPEIGEYTGNEWKLTLKDESREFAVTETAATGAPGDTVTLNYTGATVYEPPTDPNANEYISAILTDKDGNLLRYGRLTRPSETDGKVDVKIPADLAEGTYILKVFSEQYNGAQLTDYASAFDDVTLTVKNVTKYKLWVGGTQVDDSNQDDILNDGGSAKYDPATGTLTLNDPSITTLNPENAVIFCEEDGPFTVEGTATLNISGAEYGLHYQGAGDLTVNGDISATGEYGGIFAPHANISITGGEVSATASGNRANALYTEGKLTVTGGKLTANAISGGQNGIYAQGGVEISGGELKAQGTQYGISVGESANVTFANGTKAVWAMGNGSAVIMGNGSISIGDQLSLQLPEESVYHSIAGVELNDDKNQVLDSSGREAKVVNILPSAALTYSISLDPAGITITADEGYSEEDLSLYKDIVATSTGTGEVEFIVAGFKESSMYEQFGLIVGEMTATVYPIEGLTAGTYTAVVMIEDLEDRFDPIEVPVTLTVSGTAQYTVTFDPNGGKINGLDSDTALTDADGKLASLPAPTRSGRYRFDGWYTEKTGGDEVDETTVFTANTTIYAHWTRTGGSSGGGGDHTYTITVEKPENGSLSASRAAAPSGAKITVKAVPNEGFETDFVKVTDRSGNEIAVAKNDDGDYTFTMPDSNVTVKASFKEKGRPSEHLRDVDENDWYREYVDYVVEKGLMQGVADDLFAPDVTTTRAMIVTILHRMEGRPAASGKASFDDVAAGSWYADAVAWAEENEIVNGYGDGRFGPDDLITREQFAAIMYRYANFKGYDTSKSADLAGYDDASEIGDWALAAMKWANAEKLITGRTATTLVPRGEATRAEAAAIIKRFAENVK